MRDAKPSGPDGLPVLGNTVGFIRDGLAFSERLHEYGDVVAYSAIGVDFVAIYDPDLVESVLVSRSEEFRKGEFEMALGDLFAPDGLAFSEGERWHRQRLLLQPSFTPDRIEAYTDSMVNRVATIVDGWADGSVVDLRTTFSRLTLAILARTLFDIDIDGDRGAVVRIAVAAIAEQTDFSDVTGYLPEWFPRTPTERRFDRAMADLDALVEELVAERRASTGEDDDLLATLLDSEYPDGTTMDESTVRDQLVTFLFAGHETTAVALTYAVWLLASHPDVASRLHAELDSVCGERDPTFADLSALDVTERIVKEALRLYPPVYTLYRQPRVELTLGNYRLPANATLQLATYGIQRDSRWWDSPNSFRPKRWARDVNRPTYAYFPFGGGQRHCIGMRFAMSELQLALATLAKRFTFERVTEALDPSPELTLDPGAVEVRVRRRE